MKVVEVRSPFIITVAEAGQIGSKIELSIWNGSAYPTSGTGFYSLSKLIPSATQISTYYNVSNYVKEFIDNIKATYTNYVGNTEQSNEWTRFQIKKYKLVGSTYTEIGTATEYVGVNGFSGYSDGYQNPSDIKMLLLGNTNINNYYYSQSTYPNTNIQYYNLLIDKPTTTTTTINVKYERIDGIVKVITIAFAAGTTGLFNATIPISIVKTDADYINGCKVTITYTPATGSPTVKTFFTYPIEECKYTPVLCDFINRYGGWQTLTFFKQQTNTIAVKGTDYKLTQSAINYNTSIGQFKTFNTNGKQTVKLNTGFVDENYSELITDLLLSETVLLDGKPVTVKTQGSDLKTSLKDRLINYEMDFEYAYNLINDVV
jgi:hypothetical protein